MRNTLLFLRKSFPTLLRSIATAGGEAGILDDPERLQVAGNVGSSRVGGLHVVLKPVPHSVVHDGMHKVDKSGLAPDHGGEAVVVVADHNKLVR